MGEDRPLFHDPANRHPHGRVRKGLDTDVKKAGGDLSSAGVAALRSLADQIDQLERQLRSPYAKPYDRVPLAGLVREFRETYDQTFAALEHAEDPLTRALAEFTARDRVPEVSDTTGPHPPN
jgi:HPt (histidine-containing phosphotransfer) domain-containing protein